VFVEVIPLAIAFNRDPRIILLAHQIDMETTCRVLMDNERTSSAELSCDFGLKLGVHLANATMNELRSTAGLNIRAVLQPPADYARTPIGERKGLYRRRVEDMHLIAGPRERYVEHALFMGMLTLPLG
jgi:hypothetical protein